MALFSPSESTYITSFLSAVDLESSITPDGSVDPGLADRVPHLQGREALSKATKDLMALDVPVSSTYHHLSSHLNPHPQPPLASSPSPSYWPSIPGPESGPSHPHKYGTPAARSSSSPADYLARALSSRAPSADPHRLGPQPGRQSPSSSSMFSSQPQGQIASLPRAYDPPLPASSGLTLPPISTAGFQSRPASQDALSRSSTTTSPVSLPSATPTSSSSTSAKRPLPASLQPATDPSSSKRPRPSPASTSAAPDRAPHSAGPGGKPRQGVAAAGLARSKSMGGGSGGMSPAPGPPAISASASGSGSGGTAGAKGVLLSPSQKRANHIQSEQKRRANIRRGYEALCEVVPPLREAIRAEEERERTRGVELYDESASIAGGKGKARAAGGDKGKKRKGKGEDKPDGRAGPRSENVVLQKTIDYITGLLAERTVLQQRLEVARGMLAPGHPALSPDLRHVDNGVPLWEREWNGGMDLDIREDDGSEDDS